jgi:hypothetical protein
MTIWIEGQRWREPQFKNGGLKANGTLADPFSCNTNGGFGVEYDSYNFKCDCGKIAYGHQVRVNKEGVKPICIDCRMNGNYRKAKKKDEMPEKSTKEKVIIGAERIAVIKKLREDGASLEMIRSF